MLKLSSLSRVPPGTFRYKHPISGAEFARHVWDLLRDDVRAHCIGNNYPPITDAEIQQQMCERLGPEIVDRYCEGSGVSVRSIWLHWKEMVAGVKTIGNFLLAGRPLVTQEEAERRAAICRGCSMNVPFSKPCGGLCGELQEAVSAIIGGNATSQDDRLEACAVCSCFLKSKVWVPLDILRKTETEEQQENYPDFCWQKIPR